MKRILINATHNEEVRVALCNGNHLYDFDLENRTREQKKANIYKGHVTRVEPSLEAVFVEYGSKRQGFLPIREIASIYLAGNPREENIRKLIKEGDELIVQVEKEERGNKGAALSTYVSLAGRYLVLMPNNPKGGGISRQISGKLREDMKRMLGNLDLPKGMSVIIRTAGIGKTQEDLQHDLNHLLNIWNAIQDQNKKYASPRLVHQEAGVVTRAVRDYLRDDISEIWIDNEEAFIEAETFVKAVMPKQVNKLRKYTDYEPMFTSFKVEQQIETAYMREVRLPSGGSIVIDQTEALVSIDINSAKSTKGADVQETAYHTNLEAADEIARQLRLRDMGGLVVIDFIDMNDKKHQKEVEKRLVDATKYDRARVQFGDISRFGLMEMSRQRLRPSLEESTGYICPRCHGNGMIRDLRSLSLSIMRQIEQTALKERHGEVQAEVPTDIAAFLLNEKRESLVYLEQDSGTRITILPHAHLESPNFNLHFNHQGFAPSSYERVTDTQEQETTELGYEVNWQTAEAERPSQQPTRQPRQPSTADTNKSNHKTQSANSQAQPPAPVTTQALNQAATQASTQTSSQAVTQATSQTQVAQAKPAAVAWLSNLFAPTPEAQIAPSVSSADAAQAIEAIVNTGAQSRGAFGSISQPAVQPVTEDTSSAKTADSNDQDNEANGTNKERRRPQNNKGRNRYDKKNERHNKSDNRRKKYEKDDNTSDERSKSGSSQQDSSDQQKKDLPKREPNSKRESRGAIERSEAKQPQQDTRQQSHKDSKATANKPSRAPDNERSRQNRSQNDLDPNEVSLNVTEAKPTHKQKEVVHISLDETTPTSTPNKSDGSDSAQVVENAKSNTATTESQTAQNDAKQVDVKVETSQQDATDSDNDSNKVKSSDQSATEARSKPDSAKPDSATYNSAKDASAIDKDDSASVLATMTFDSEALFADRYVAAKKFGQASNDPRQVKAKLQSSNDAEADQSEAETTEVVDSAANEAKTTAAKAPAIKGSVGEFIHTHLAQANARLEKNGVINCFLAALSAYNETSAPKPRSVKKSKPASSAKAQAFSFVNYGYEDLSPSYLERFSRMTAAVATYQMQQGKTEVEPAPVGKRAANDPRGQHPDYDANKEDSHDDSAVVANGDDTSTRGNSADSVNSDANSTINATNADASSNEDTVSKDSAVDSAIDSADQSEKQSEKSPMDAMAELLRLNVGQFVGRVLGQEGEDLIAAGNTEAAFLKALQQPFDVLLSVAKAVEHTVEEGVEEHVENPADATDDKTESTVVETSDNADSNNLESDNLDSVNSDSNANSVDETHPANVLTNDAQAEAVSEHSADALAAEQAEATNKHDTGAGTDADANAEHTDEQTNTGANKTSIESYKSMIENISEQLLPQTGLLNLSSAKAPKSRSRKTKTGDDSDSDS